MQNITFYKLWHVDLDIAQTIVPGDFIKLNDLPINPTYAKMWDFLQEYRVHISDIKCEAPYVGFVSASFANKFGHEANNLLKERLVCQDFLNSDLASTVVSQSKWFFQATNYHVGIDKYILQYMSLAKIDQSLLFRPIIYCNSFICKTDLYLEARDIFQKNILELFESNNYELNFADGGYGHIRKGGCLAERLWGLTLRSLAKTYAAPITNITWRNMVQ